MLVRWPTAALGLLFSKLGDLTTVKLAPGSGALRPKKKEGNPKRSREETFDGVFSGFFSGF